MKNLLEGLSRYESRTRQRYSKHFASLAAGQSPHTLFITCSDSRVVPNLLASADPGELFVVRNVASLVPPYADQSDASVEAAVVFAVENLGVSDIVICGHSGCGGIKAACAGYDPNSSLGRWLVHTKPGLEKFRAHGGMDASLPENDQASQVCTLHQLQHLLTYPGVRSRVRAGKLQLNAWWFDIAPGELLAYDSAVNRYIPARQMLAQMAEKEGSRNVA